MAIDLADGRPWILLPGTLCSGRVFTALLDALGVPQDARHVIALGHPQVEDYRAELEAACTQDSVICGFSLGAIVAAHMADQLPAREYFLFALNPYADRPDKRADRLSFATDVRQLGGAEAMASRLPPLAGPQPDLARDMILQMADETAALMPAQTELALTRPGALDSLSRSRAPVSLFTGSRDGWAPIALARDVAQAAPLGRVQTLPELGHYALVEDPDACCQAVESRFNDT